MGIIEEIGVKNQILLGKIEVKKNKIFKGKKLD